VIEFFVILLGKR